MKYVAISVVWIVYGAIILSCVLYANNLEVIKTVGVFGSIAAVLATWAVTESK